MGFGGVRHRVSHLESLGSGSTSAYLYRGSVRPSGRADTGASITPSIALLVRYLIAPRPRSLSPRCTPPLRITPLRITPLRITPLLVAALRITLLRSPPLCFALLTPLVAVATMDYVNKYEGRTLWGEGRDLVAKWGATKVIMRARPAGESGFGVVTFHLLGPACALRFCLLSFRVFAV